MLGPGVNKLVSTKSGQNGRFGVVQVVVASRRQVDSHGYHQLTAVECIILRIRIDRSPSLETEESSSSPMPSSRGHHAPVRDVHGPAGHLQALEPGANIVGQYSSSSALAHVIDESTAGPLAAAADEQGRSARLHRTIARIGPQIERLAFTPRSRT